MILIKKSEMETNVPAPTGIASLSLYSPATRWRGPDHRPQPPGSSARARGIQDAQQVLWPGRGVWGAGGGADTQPSRVAVAADPRRGGRCMAPLRDHPGAHGHQGQRGEPVNRAQA